MKPGCYYWARFVPWYSDRRWQVVQVCAEHVPAEPTVYVCGIDQGFAASEFEFGPEVHRPCLPLVRGQ